VLAGVTGGVDAADVLVGVRRAWWAGAGAIPAPKRPVLAAGDGVELGEGVFVPPVGTAGEEEDGDPPPWLRAV
jgi:hypothetical protein